ncbi:DUF7133 domain-containing protein [Tuwongella immobilis]|uniref:Cytochrome c domain-containing protein n=1 Tax=Tuwongella immobilis TaxID=692036 RepID=A0A6C2YPS9_9BACT|nr:c-type cytochrome [Tuwongella immobilis]VIP03404.1 heme-binding protein : Uncharacterized protein OS=Planctomyces maris DSM 8797 GN=PM8797T_21638 PE=4 SV=1: Cytochrom_C [Tuwongella immobilis]VTS04180.1 heme-binding protein : Uncharacterized protein OS=Planctomyces maris DSM 8797 GN=PM8797T_21638 PE=4 SV=1: Cytochrom_C [Tuwongella immobilis]
MRLIDRGFGGVAFLVLLSAATASAGVDGLRVPTGFTIEQVATDAQATDITCMTCDPKGRVIVAGRGYLRRLHDTNRDGIYDRVEDLQTPFLDGAMGLLAEAGSLTVTSNGGVWRLLDADGDDRWDGPPKKILSVKTGGEHDAHALRRGPDRWLYLLCGNMSGISPKEVSKKSILQTWDAGTLVRISPDDSQVEVVAHGFRNAYGFDFGPTGDAFTFDSDNERCIGLPWYEPTRFYRIVGGGHHGWLSPQRSGTWRMPPYFPDVVPPIAELGRGSPTGGVAAHLSRFPAPYRNGFWAADWTLGQVWFIPVDPASGMRTDKPSRFIETTGSVGFAPTSLAVDPTRGDLLISVGGRGTQGAVYRVRWTGPPPIMDSGNPQPIPKLTAERSLERELLREAQAESIDWASWEPKLIDALGSSDRMVRIAAGPLLRRCSLSQLQTLLVNQSQPLIQAMLALELADRQADSAIPTAIALLERKSNDSEVRLLAIRAIERRLGDLGDRRSLNRVAEGYALRGEVVASRPAIQASLERVFPTGDATLDRELLRLAAMIRSNSETLWKRVLDSLAMTGDPLEQIHRLIVMSRFQWATPRPESELAPIVAVVLELDRRLDAAQLPRDRNWPLRMRETRQALQESLPNFSRAVVEHPAFGRPEHAIWLDDSSAIRIRAAERYRDAIAASDADANWPPEIIARLGELPVESVRSVLERLASESGNRDAVVSILARDPKENDRRLLLSGLESLQPAVVDACLKGLGQLNRAGDADEIVAFVRLLQRAQTETAGEKWKPIVTARLRESTGQTFGSDAKLWVTWLEQAKPAIAKRLSSSNVDWSAWQQRLAKIDWSAGDAEAGRRIFQQTGCIACHGGASGGGLRLGPDLSGVTKRFRRDDLLLALIQPDRDISSRYRAMEYETDVGQIVVGMIVYEATDGVLLQTATATIRLNANQIVSKRPSTRSLMPSGLLDPLSNQDIANLVAYLTSISEEKRSKPEKQP